MFQNLSLSSLSDQCTKLPCSGYMGSLQEDDLNLRGRAEFFRAVLVLRKTWLRIAKLLRDARASRTRGVCSELQCRELLRRVFRCYGFRDVVRTPG